jgi:hypothetical protein
MRSPLWKGNQVNLTSIFGDVAIGKDTSGNFRPSIEGLAVRMTPTGKFVAEVHDQLMDVSDLTFDGAENFIFRVPVQQIKKGDLIITSENPFYVLFVQKVKDDGTICGLDPRTSAIIDYVPPTSLFKTRFFIKVISLMDGLMGKIGPDNLLPLLLLSGNGAADKTDGGLSMFLLMQTLGGKGADLKSLLPLLMLSGGKGDFVQTLLLMQAIKGESHFMTGLFDSQDSGTSRSDPASHPPAQRRVVRSA